VADRSHGRLVSDFVIAGCTAALTVVQAVFTKPDIQLALAKAAVLLTFATFFDLFALTAAGFDLGGHKQTLALKGPPRERAVGN
jgi:thiol:disulfide interchange protein